MLTREQRLELNYIFNLNPFYLAAMRRLSTDEKLIEHLEEQKLDREYMKRRKKYHKLTLQEFVDKYLNANN
jgi:hypothetical protein